MVWELGSAIIFRPETLIGNFRLYLFFLIIFLHVGLTNSKEEFITVFLIYDVAGSRDELIRHHPIE